jgi:ribosomal protein L15
MTIRKRRKQNKVRGERTHGEGDTKNNRGGGCRGGRGKAGGNKGKFASIGRFYERKCRLKPKDKGNSITLGQLDVILDRLVAKGKVLKEKEMYIIDENSGYSKVLSQGNTEKEITLKINASVKAIKKIVAAGGKFEFEKKNYDPASEDAGLEFEENAKEEKE